MIGLLVSRRPHLIDQAVSIAEAFCDDVIVVMDDGDFASTLRNALPKNEPVFKLDDDDWYPPHHGLMMTNLYRPEYVVWNELDVFGCDGVNLGRGQFISGGILPPGVEIKADETGRIEPSLAGYPKTWCYTGSKKYQCPAQWLWNDKPAWGNRIRCEH